MPHSVCARLQSVLQWLLLDSPSRERPIRMDPILHLWLSKCLQPMEWDGIESISSSGRILSSRLRLAGRDTEHKPEVARFMILTSVSAT